MIEKIEFCLGALTEVLEKEDFWPLMEDFKVEFTTLELNEQAYTYTVLRKLKDKIEAMKKAVNKAYASSAETLVRSMSIEAVEPPMRLRHATLSPSAKAYYTIKDDIAFFKYCREKGIVEDMNGYFKLVRSQTSLREVLDAHLLEGKDFPACVKAHLEAKVTIRRKDK